MPNTVVAADDHRLVLEGVRSALAGAADLELIGTARSGSEALPLIQRLKPDLALLDVRMPGVDGLACLEILRKRAPRTKVAMLSVYDDPARVQAAFARGATAYILKSIAPADLPGALRQALQETVYTSIGAPPADERPGAPAGLTERETLILRLATEGRSNRQIAGELWVTEQTVKFHLTNVYRKLGVRNRTQAARIAYRLGVAQSPAADPVDAERGA